jgi:hypothetical protein
MDEVVSVQIISGALDLLLIKMLLGLSHHLFLTLHPHHVLPLNLRAVRVYPF